MEENKKTSKEILPESEREHKHKIDVETCFLALEAAEREVEEKEEVINTLKGELDLERELAKSLVQVEKAYNPVCDYFKRKAASKNLEINELKIEIEELKSKLDISGYKGNINENLC